MLNDKKLDWLLALTVFLISFGVYFSTMAPTLSFWDCGELIAVGSSRVDLQACKLEYSIVSPK